MKKAIVLACSISASLLSMNEENPMARRLRELFPEAELVNQTNSGELEIARKAFVGRQGPNLVTFEGANLFKIQEISIVIREADGSIRTIAVTHSLNDEAYEMSMEFNIENLAAGRHIIRFSYLDANDVLQNLDKDFYIDGNNAQAGARSSAEIMAILQSNFKWIGNCRQILIAPQPLECHYRDVNHACQRDPLGATDLVHAVREGKFDLAGHIIEEGCDVNIGTTAGEYPIHFAAENGDINMIKFLLEKGATLFVKNNKGRSPRDYALKKGRNEMVDYIDEIHKNHVADDWKKVAILQIVEREELAVLIEQRIPPLYYAVEMGDVDMLNSFLEQGCDRAVLNADWMRLDSFAKALDMIP